MGDESSESGDDGIGPQEYRSGPTFPSPPGGWTWREQARHNTAANGVSLRYPYRATGKLLFQDGASTFVCSASLIKKGVLVTAAHCVARFGQNRFYTNFQFHPGPLRRNFPPYGIWSVNGRWVTTSYFNGTDTCSTPGHRCGLPERRRRSERLLRKLPPAPIRALQRAGMATAGTVMASTPATWLSSTSSVIRSHSTVDLGCSARTPKLS